jgi:hypothetical protein
MTSRAMKTTAPTTAPTIPAIGLVVEDEGGEGLLGEGLLEEGLLEEAAGRGVVISNLIFATKKINGASPTPGGLGIVAVDIVTFIWSPIYPIVGSEPRTTDVEPSRKILGANDVF